MKLVFALYHNEAVNFVPMYLEVLNSWACPAIDSFAEVLGSC